MRPLRRSIRTAGFLAWFALEIVRSAAAVLRDIATPGSAATPRVVRLRLDPTPGVRTEVLAAVLGALITLTPGTLTLGAAPAKLAAPTGQDTGDADQHGHQDGDQDGDRPGELLVHSMYHRDDDGALADLHDLQQRLLHALDPRPAQETP